jgi:tripartite-type tricarboxylate transporter receptor subunit TctC
MKKILITFLLLLGSIAQADPYKEIPKSVKFIMPYGPGSIVDAQYRHFQKFMEARGVNVIGSYKPGAGGIIASNDLLDSPRDGSVIMMNATSNSWIAETRLGKKVIEPLMSTGGSGIVMITYPGSNYENYDNLVLAIKNNDPDVKVGWQGVGNILSMNQLAEKLNSKPVLMVPYKSSVDSSRDVTGKHLPLALIPLNTAKPLADAGTIKIVFGFGPGKIIPTDVLDIKKRITSWRHGELFFVGVPPGTDSRIIKAWSTILKEWLDDKETEEYFKKVYFGKDVGGPEYVNEVIAHQGASLKKYNVEIK